MHNVTSNARPATDDIDLLLLAERFFLFIRRYIWIYTLAVIIGLLAGFLTWRSMPTVYHSKLIVHSFTLSNQNFIQVISNWNKLLKSGDHDILAATLQMKKSSLGKVKQIKASEIQKVFTTSNPNGFYIEVYVTDNAVLPELQAGILNGMENVDLIKKQLAIKKQNLRQLIGEVAREISKLDSTKSRIESMIAAPSGRTSSLIIDISGLNKQRIELNEKLLYYQQDLELASAVQVLQGFTGFSRPAGPNLFVWLGLGLLSALSITFILTAALRIRGRIKNRPLAQ